MVLPRRWYAVCWIHGKGLVGMSDCIEMFKHGVADGLLHGTRDESKNDSYYKQGYDYGITLYGEMENLE